MKLKNLFARHGIPETVVSDNGTQFSSTEFQDFATSWNFSHVTSSPHFPQSNGQAESAVKIAKGFLSQDDPTLALLSYRSTPLPTLGFSPAELLFGRRIRTSLPTLSKTLTPRFIDAPTVTDRDIAAKEKQKLFYDRRHGAQPLSTLQPGDPVLVRSDEGRKWRQEPAEVVSQVAPRSFLLQHNGRQLRRNRRHLLRCPAPVASPSSPTPATPASVGPSLSPTLRRVPATLSASSSTPQTTPQSLPAVPSPTLPGASPPAPEIPLSPPATPVSTLPRRSGRLINKPARFLE